MGTVLKERTDAQEEIAYLQPRVQVGGGAPNDGSPWNYGDVVRQALPRHNAIGFIDDRDNAVVGMQINPAVHHLRLLVAKCDSMTHISSTASLVAKAG